MAYMSRCPEENKWLKLSRHRVLSLFFCWSILAASVPALAQEALRCSAKTPYLSDAQVDRVETEQYVRYEFGYSSENHFWNGVIFEFRSIEGGNPLLRGFKETDEGNALSKKLAKNLQSLMTDSLVYQEVSEIESHELDQGTIITFNASYAGDQDLYAVYGEWHQGRLRFFRTNATSNGNESEPVNSSVAAESLNQIIKSCRFNEA